MFRSPSEGFNSSSLSPLSFSSSLEERRPSDVAGRSRPLISTPIRGPHGSQHAFSPLRLPIFSFRSRRPSVHSLLLFVLLFLSTSIAAALDAKSDERGPNSTLEALPAPPAAPIDVHPADSLEEDGNSGPKKQKNIPEIVQKAKAEQRLVDRTTSSTSTARPSTKKSAGSSEAADLDVNIRKAAKPKDPTDGTTTEKPQEVPLLHKKEVGNRTEEQAVEEEVIPALTTEEFRVLHEKNATSSPPPPTPKVVRDDSKDAEKDSSNNRTKEADRPTTSPPAPNDHEPSNRTESGPKTTAAAAVDGAKNSTDQQQPNEQQQQQREEGGGEKKMLLVEQHAIDLIPLQDLLNAMLFALAATFMVVGGAIPYVFQYVEIHRRKSALGFSLLVCLALCVANILRILFWFGKRFETVLLCQSVVMIGCMLLMLEISVRMNKRMLPPSQMKSIWKGDLINAFWKWNDLTSFIAALAVFTLIASVVTFLFIRFPIYVEGLGMVALLVEACLGLPQLIRNFQRKSTQGMSVNMVLMWLLGDIGKTVYFVVRKNPAQFWICGGLQITIDILILGQVYFFNRGNARIPTYQPRDADEKTTA